MKKIILATTFLIALGIYLGWKKNDLSPVTAIVKDELSLHEEVSFSPAAKTVLTPTDTETAVTSASPQHTIEPLPSDHSSAVADPSTIDPVFLDYSPEGLAKRPDWQKQNGEEYLSLFRTLGVRHDQENTMGWVSDDVPNIQAFLDLKVNSNGGDGIVSSLQRDKSLFFSSLAGKTFIGSLTDRVNGKQWMNFGLSLGKPTDSIPDRISNLDMRPGPEFPSAKIVELRTIDPQQSGVWRHDYLKNGVYLPNKICPWSEAYAFERKQFFYLSRQKKLVANVYCTANTRPFSWQRVAVIVADLSK